MPAHSGGDGSTAAHALRLMRLNFPLALEPGMQLVLQQSTPAHGAMDCSPTHVHGRRASRPDQQCYPVSLKLCIFFV